MKCLKVGMLKEGKALAGTLGFRWGREGGAQAICNSVRETRKKGVTVRTPNPRAGCSFPI